MSVKAALFAALRARLEEELATLVRAAEAAREAATHAEAKPENKYDTRGLEASYLAGAQAERVGELQAAVRALASLAPRDFRPDEPAAATALVDVEDEEGAEASYLLLPLAGGYRLPFEGRDVTTLTTRSPLGRAFLGKTAGESATAQGPQGERDLVIVRVR